MNINYDIPEPDINVAIEEMSRLHLSDEDYDFYCKYYPCLTITNEYEQIKQTKKYIDQNSNVLTVSGSGEQLIFFKLYGAKNVITFDCSYNSYLMTQLKIAALKTYDTPKDYYKFLNDLYKTEDKFFLKTESINRVIKNLKETDRNYLCSAVQKIRLFYTNTCCNRYKFTESNYSKLREIVKEPFPFILSDIKNLDEKLDGQKFDIIYYSNICDFLHLYEVRIVLEKTQEYLNPDGKLFLVTSPGYKKDVITTAIDYTFGLSLSRVFAEKDGFYLIMVQNKTNVL